MPAEPIYSYHLEIHFQTSHSQLLLYHLISKRSVIHIHKLKMSSIRKYSTASLLCLLMVLRLTYGAAIANRTTNSDLQSRDWDLFPTDNGVMGSACAEMMDARLPNFEYEVGVSTKTELPEAGVWDLCYIRGKYLWTFDDTAVTKCLIDLHHRQDNVCISVKGSRCEKVRVSSACMHRVDADPHIPNTLSYSPSSPL